MSNSLVIVLFVKEEPEDIGDSHDNLFEDPSRRVDADLDLTLVKKVEGSPSEGLKLSIFRCSSCSCVFSQKIQRDSHMCTMGLNKISDVETQYSCLTCQKVFTNKKELYIHLKLHSVVHKKMSFICVLCEKKFDTNHARTIHYKNDHPDEKPYRCEECGKGFSHKSTLYSHKITHADNPSFECPECKKPFKRRDSFTEHLLIHKGPRHQCPHCTKRFVQKSNLIRHIRIHSGEKPYQCTHCPKKFSDKGACNAHIAIHVGPKMQCPFCERTFSRKQKLTYHVRKHTGENLLACTHSKCDKKFTYPAALRDHLLTHDTEEGYCTLCQTSFLNAHCLRRHIKDKHCAGNNIKCPGCTQVFADDSSCRMHIVISHLQIKPYRCIICNTKYCRDLSMKDHLRKIHNIDDEDLSSGIYVETRSLDSIDFIGMEPILLTENTFDNSAEVSEGSSLECDFRDQMNSTTVNCSEDMFLNLIPDVILSEA
ncbi:gastrula zinc finger protein XlCGF57.1-like isoform X2 [Artemia franciscana]|uniref:C2H2-type domain-containing protein n=1 Tax=Artemia franciscana TaxID=6661 RepID=A0AA88I387_ARTSF|nr:hypothetical protein QYM36_001738 [Artemia franciscana]KAK2723161.1 hypothetical protein QYM36_001738 [Artemia franciscana]